MRLRQKPWADKELSQNQMYIPIPKNLKGAWHNHFNNNNPIHLEIGCGKGKFIIENALNNPDINFIAMEKFERILCMALKAAALHKLSNLYFFKEDAYNIEDLFDSDELSCIYINFCDPWRARGKWRKRRLTHRDFIKRYENVMTTRQIHFKTDNAVLFNFSIDEFKEMGWQLKNITHDLHNSDIQGNIMTEYETKFTNNNMAICSLEAFKP